MVTLVACAGIDLRSDRCVRLDRLYVLHTLTLA